MDIIDVNTLFGPLPAAAADLSVDELGTLMEKNAIRACCTLSTVGLLLDHNAGNSATRAACADNTSLIPVATVNPQTYFGGDGLFGRFAAEGFRMARFFPGLQGWDVDYAPFLALAKQPESERVPILVDIDRPGVPTRMVQAFGAHHSPLILGGVDERTVSEAVVLMRHYPHVFVETSRLVATGVLKHVVDCVGAERVLYGSGAPLRPMASGLGILRVADLTDAQRALVLGGNARSLLGL